MKTPAKILAVDDVPRNVKLLADLLTAKSLKASLSGNGLLLLYVNLLLHIGYLSFQMPYSEDLIVPP